MAQLSDDCFAFGGELMSAAAALALLREKLTPVTDSERVALKDAAGRILAEPLVATRDVPPADNVAVDGYAVRFEDLVPDAETVLAIAGRAAAGHPLREPAPPRGAIRVFTGAPAARRQRHGADAGGLQGRQRRRHDPRRHQARRQLPQRRRGHQGRNLGSGGRPPAAGARNRPRGLARPSPRCPSTARCASRCSRAATSWPSPATRWRWARSTTPTAATPLLQALLQGLGAQVSDLGILADKPDAVSAALESAAQNHDLVLTSGGMSTGEEDHVKAAVEALGRLHFWRLAIKPGRPVAMGQLGRVPFVGLPGNPVAVMVTFFLLARPLMLLLSGAVDAGPRLYRVKAGFDYKKRPNRTEYVRARLVRDAEGGWTRREISRATAPAS